MVKKINKILKMVIKYSLQNILAKNAMELTLKIALNVQLKIIENQ